MYEYVGPKALLELIDEDRMGRIIATGSDIDSWLVETGQQAESGHSFVATFVIDLQHRLRINDRRSEHVVCAGGKPVLSAGEITFEQNKAGAWQISRITNQSTGYCPDPESWSEADLALSKLGMDYPDHFTTAFIFRICRECQSINIVKDDYYYCMVCDSKLD